MIRLIAHLTGPMSRGRVEPWLIKGIDTQYVVWLIGT